VDARDIENAWDGPPRMNRSHFSISSGAFSEHCCPTDSDLRETGRPAIPELRVERRR